MKLSSSSSCSDNQRHQTGLANVLTQSYFRAGVVKAAVNPLEVVKTHVQRTGTPCLSAVKEIYQKYGKAHFLSGLKPEMFQTLCKQTVVWTNLYRTSNQDPFKRGATVGLINAIVFTPVQQYRYHQMAGKALPKKLTSLWKGAGSSAAYTTLTWGLFLYSEKYFYEKSKQTKNNDVFSSGMLFQRTAQVSLCVTPIVSGLDMIKTFALTQEKLPQYRNMLFNCCKAFPASYGSIFLQSAPTIYLLDKIRNISSQK